MVMMVAQERKHEAMLPSKVSICLLYKICNETQWLDTAFWVLTLQSSIGIRYSTLQREDKQL